MFCPSFAGLSRSPAIRRIVGERRRRLVPGRKRPFYLLFLRAFRTSVRNRESPYSRCRSKGRAPVTDLVLPENDDGADTLPSKKGDANAAQFSSSGLYSPVPSVFFFGTCFLVHCSSLCCGGSDGWNSRARSSKDGTYVNSGFGSPLSNFGFPKNESRRLP